jgi:hypothetical protein
MYRVGLLPPVAVILPFPVAVMEVMEETACVVTVEVVAEVVKLV